MLAVEEGINCLDLVFHLAHWSSIVVFTINKSCTFNHSFLHSPFLYPSLVLKKIVHKNIGSKQILCLENSKFMPEKYSLAFFLPDKFVSILLFVRCFPTQPSKGEQYNSLLSYFNSPKLFLYKRASAIDILPSVTFSQGINNWILLLKIVLMPSLFCFKH